MAHEAQVDSTSVAYKSMVPSWTLVRTLDAGTWAMRAAGTKYLPQFQKEPALSYDVRKNRSVLTNAFAKAVKSLTGKVFSRPITISENMPEALVGWSDDVDLMGNDLNVFAKRVFKDGLTVGLAHILTDFPVTEPNQTLAAERNSGNRPFLKQIRAEDLIAAFFVIRGGKEFLTQVRIRENTLEQDGDFGERVIERIRVLRPGTQQLWTKVEDGEYVKDGPELVVTGSDGQQLDFIPLVTWYTDRTGFMTSRLPLMDLAHLNVAHWQSASDQRNILTTTRLPLLVATGFDDEEEIIVAPNWVAKTRNDEAKLGYAEHSGVAVASGRQDLEDLKQEMAVMAMEPLMPRTGTQTATARALDTSEANCELQMHAMGLKDALETAYGHMAVFGGQETGGTLDVNSEFGMSLDQVADLQALSQARMAGDITRETWWDEMKRRNVLSEDFDAEEEKERLEEEGIPLTNVGTIENFDPLIPNT